MTRVRLGSPISNDSTHQSECLTCPAFAPNWTTCEAKAKGVLNPRAQCAKFTQTASGEKAERHTKQREAYERDSDDPPALHLGDAVA